MARILPFRLVAIFAAAAIACLILVKPWMTLLYAVRFRQPGT